MRKSCGVSDISFDACGSCADIVLACSQPCGLATTSAVRAHIRAKTRNIQKPVIHPRRAPPAVLNGAPDGPSYSFAATKPAAQRTTGSKVGTSKAIAINVIRVPAATRTLIQTAREFLNEIPEAEGTGGGRAA